MTIKLLLLIFVLTFLNVASTAQADRPANLAWGDYSRGLRMAVWTNPATDQVFYVIRNFSTRKVLYTNLVMGFEIYARQGVAAKWRRIKLKPAEPREEIALLICYTVQPKEEVQKSYLDLREYDFPADWNGLVEVRIVRILSLTERMCDKNYRTAKVKSRTFNVKLPLTAAAAQR